MPANIAVVSPRPISARDFGAEVEIDPQWITNVDRATGCLSPRATGLLIRGEGDEPLGFAVEALATQAMEADIPILASGLGMHHLNVVLNGDEARPTSRHIESTEGDVARQSVFLAPGAKVSSTIGGSGWLTIPCRHGSGIFQAGLAPGLMVSAISDDRVVEAFEMPGRRWIFGVQWDVLGAIKMPRGFDNILIAFVERATGK